MTGFSAGENGEKLITFSLFSLEKVSPRSFMLGGDKGHHSQWGRSMPSSSVVSKHSGDRGGGAERLINLGPDIPPPQDRGWQE